MRLSDKQLARLQKLVDKAREEGDPDAEHGLALDDFLDSNIKLIVDEIQDGRDAVRLLAKVVLGGNPTGVEWQRINELIREVSK